MVANNTFDDQPISTYLLRYVVFGNESITILLFIKTCLIKEVK